MESLPKGVKRQASRRADNGTVFYYYWRATKERLPDPEREPEKFARAVARCEKGINQPPAKPQRATSGPVAGTLGALIIERQKNRKYLMSTKPNTRAQYDYDLRRIAKQFPDFLAVRTDEIDRRSVRVLQDAYARSSPSYANRIVRALSALFAFAVRQDLLTVNPCDGLDQYPGGSHTRSTDEQISFAIANLPPYLARGIFLGVYTGQRGGDCAAMCWPQYDGRLLRLTQEDRGRSCAAGLHLPRVEGQADRWRGEDKVRSIDASQDRILRTMRRHAWAQSESYQSSMALALRKHPELDGLSLARLAACLCRACGRARCDARSDQKLDRAQERRDVAALHAGGAAGPSRRRAGAGRGTRRELDFGK